MGLNIPDRNTDYDEITDSSTYEDKLDVVLNILKKSHSPIWLEYSKLKIPYQNEKLFNAKLKATGLVEYRQSPTAFNPEFKLNDKGYLILEEYESYSQYLQKLETEKQTKNIMDENEIKNHILRQLNTIGVNSSCYLDQLSDNTGFDQDIIQACCLEFNKLGYVLMDGKEVSMLPAGKLFIKAGGYKKDTTLAIKFEQIGHRYTTMGDQSPIAGDDFTQSLKEGESSPENTALQTAQMENMRLSSELLKLQIKEVRSKKKFAVLGALGGAILTYISTHIKEISEFIQSVLHRK
jgi:hypothetical protein